MQQLNAQAIVDWHSSYWTKKLQCSTDLEARPATVAESLQGLCHALILRPARLFCDLHFQHAVELPIGPLLAYLKQQNKLDCVVTPVQRRATEIALRTLLRDCSSSHCSSKRQVRINQAVCAAVEEILKAMDTSYAGIGTLISLEKDIPKARDPDPLNKILSTLERAYTCVPKTAGMPQLVIE